MSRTVEYTTPLQGIPYYRNVGVIKASDQSGAQYCVGEIRYERYDDQNFQYVVTPYWEQIDRLPIQIFSGIPGFDMSVRRDNYYRVNITPGFIQMRTPSESREDLWELLDEVGLDYYDRFEWLLRSGKRCGDDNLIVVRKRENRHFDVNKEEIDLNQLQPGDKVFLNHLYDITSADKDFSDCVYRLLINGAEVYLSKEQRWIEAEERRAMLYLLLSMKQYAGNTTSIHQNNGIRLAKQAGKYRGRTKIAIDPIFFQKVAEQFMKKEIREEQALSTLGITRATFYRRLRELKEKPENNM